MRKLGTSYEVAGKQLQNNSELTCSELTMSSTVMKLLRSIHLHNGSFEVVAQV